MQIGLVLGTATATVKHPTFEGERLLVVQMLTADERPDGEPVIVLDRIGARIGDRVLAVNDGQYVQDTLGRTCPAYWSVVGLPDP
jgi:ethanolamine utilization protein EutN